MSVNEGGASDTVGSGLSVPTRPARPLVLYYPDALKHHYIDLLKRWKGERARVTGKPVGWQSIRDMIMEPEDAVLKASDEADRKKRNAREVRRLRAERDSFFTVEHLKAWARGDALPSDPRCYFIERFLNRQRRDGTMGTVEADATKARQAFIKEALFALYRVDQRIKQGGDPDLLALACGQSSFSGMAFLIEGAAVDQTRNGVDVIMRIGTSDRLMFDVEVLMLRRPVSSSQDARRGSIEVADINPHQIRLLYAGVLVPFEVPRPDLTVRRLSDGFYISRWGVLASNAYNVTAADLGLEGDLPSFLQCGTHIVADGGRVSVTLLAGGQLVWLSGIMALTQDSQVERVIVCARTATPVGEDVASALARRDFARPLYG